jgi:hypothetical protein
MGLTIRVRFGLVSGLPNEKIPVISDEGADDGKRCDVWGCFTDLV